MSDGEVLNNSDQNATPTIKQRQRIGAVDSRNVAPAARTCCGAVRLWPGQLVLVVVRPGGATSRRSLFCACAVSSSWNPVTS